MLRSRMGEGGQRAQQFCKNCGDEGPLAGTGRALIRPVGHLLPCNAREKGSAINSFIKIPHPVIPAKARTQVSTRRFSKFRSCC
jgi:hypothetical protein